MVRSIFYVWKNILKFAFHFSIVESVINIFLKFVIEKADWLDW